jgi:hypothetical protein
MSIPITGAIILVAATCFLLFSPRLLYAAMILSIPFSATAVVNFPWAEGQYGTDKSVMAWQLFAILWICHDALSGLPQWHRHGWFLTRRPRFWLLVFLVVVIASLFVPIILNGTSRVETFITSPTYRAPGIIPLRFGSYNLSQFAYLAFGVLIAVIVAAKNCHPQRLFYTLRLYVGSCVFAAGWGLFQWWCHFTGYIYPALIFNTGTNLSTAGYAETINVGSLIFGRISSVATEPSVLAEELLLACVVLIICLGLRHPLLPRGWNWLATSLITIILFMSTSTTAYVGIFGMLIFAGVALARAGSPRWKYYPAIALAALTAAAVLIKKVQIVGILAQSDILSKSQTFSGMAREGSVKLAAQAFLRYPILGTGWHNVNSADLLFLILANTGIIGALAFGAFLIPAFRTLWRLTASGNLLAAVLFASLALWVLLVEGAGLSVPIGYNWLVLGLAVAAMVSGNSNLPVDHAQHFAVVRASPR